MNPKRWYRWSAGEADAAQVLVFTPDNLEPAQYPSDTRQEDWAHDFPRLLAFGARP